MFHLGFSWYENDFSGSPELEALPPQNSVWLPVWAWLLMRTLGPCSERRARCQDRMYARRMFQKTLANTPTHPHEGPHQKCARVGTGGRCGAPAHRRHSIKCTSRRRGSPSPNPLGASWTITRRYGRCGRVLDLMLEHCNSCISFSARFGPLRPTRSQNMAKNSVIHARSTKMRLGVRFLGPVI